MDLELRRTEHLFHYTSADVGVFNILRDGRIRLSPYEATNDPAESEQKFPTLSVHHDDCGLVEGDVDMTQKIWGQADWWLRRYVKLACFTQDFAVPDEAFDADAFRGWNHPSLWAHYGDNFSGICLRFDRAALLQALEENLGDQDQMFSGSVEYSSNWFSALPVEGLDLGQINYFGLDAVVARYVEMHHREPFFSKHQDGAGEREYRLLISDASLLPRYLNIRECLTGVILGDKFPIARRDALAELLSEMREVELFQVRSLNGRLALLPTQLVSPGRPEVTARLIGTPAERLESLRSVEASRQEAYMNGLTSTTGVAQRLLVSVHALAAQMHGWAETSTDVHQSITAVPVYQRMRAPGVPGEVVEFGCGWMSVTNQIGGCGAVLIIGVALQLIESRSVRLHATAAIEVPEPNGHKRDEVWRSSRECDLDHAEQEAEGLVIYVLHGLTEAKQAFQARRVLT